MQRFIMFRGDDEVIVTTPESEAETVKAYFTEGGRDLEEYDREEANNTEAVLIKNGYMQIKF